jgi:hypothetical protein
MLLDLYRLTGSRNENDKEANEPDYNDDEDQLEEKQEEEVREINYESSFLTSLFQQYFNYD